MKKSAAIISLFIFFLAQFGRVINFCICEVEVYQQTNSLSCDCERQLLSTIQTDQHGKDQPAQHVTSRLNADELFTFHAPAIHISRIINHNTARPLAYTEALYDTASQSIFHPPLYAC